MEEEFHGEGDVVYQQLYGWGTLNANVWLPSMSELVGTTGAQDTSYGCYLSAMQGLNLSGNPWTDAQGGAQFAYFVLYNVSGGGEAMMNICNHQAAWSRSPLFNSSTNGCAVTGGGVGHVSITAAFAVHPAVKKSVTRAWKRQEKERK